MFINECNYKLCYILKKTFEIKDLAIDFGTKKSAVYF